MVKEIQDIEESEKNRTFRIDEDTEKIKEKVEMEQKKNEEEINNGMDRGVMV